MGVCWVFVVFLVLFPKGGFKIGTLPLTWGYLLIGLSAPVILPLRMLFRPLQFPRQLIGALLLLFPMQIVFAYGALVNGVFDPGYAFSSFVNLFILPWMFLLFYAPFLPVLDGRRLANYIRACILIAALWGIFLFFLHPITNFYLEIPYLTVNAQDYGELEVTKDISRGLFYKLISTYNSGNLYGAATLILLPLYRLFEPARWRRGVVLLALFLTLSRSVWVGIIFYELLPLLGTVAAQIKTFPVVNFKKFRTQFLILVGFAAVIVLASALFVSSYGGVASFLLDPTGNGRLSQQTLSGQLTILPSAPVGPFAEIVYLSALQVFGLVGLLAFTLLMVSPVLLLLVDRTALESPSRRAAFKGLMIYSVVAMMDGAFDFIPVMAFYWFTYMIYLFGWPAFRSRPARRVARLFDRGSGDAPDLPAAA
jgi:hypothetical protein